MVHVHGLKLEEDYTLTLRVAPADGQRYKFVNMKWIRVGESEVNQNEVKQLYIHPSSPNNGAFWMKKPVSFKGVKITHFSESKHGNVSVSVATHLHKHMHSDTLNNIYALYRSPFRKPHPTTPINSPVKGDPKL